MTMHRVLQETKAKNEKTIEALSHELGKVRTGRATTSLLDDIRVDYYGNATPLNQVATLGVPEPRLLTITPWEANMIGPIEKAISTSDLGLTPSNDGKVIRVPIPPLNEERRKDLVKMIKKYGEEAKISIRYHRREAMDELKSLEKSKDIAEDEHKHLDKDVQKLTDEYVEKVEESLEHKEKEIMEV